MVFDVVLSLALKLGLNCEGISLWNIIKSISATHDKIPFEFRIGE